jgi:hypothetical protein
VAAGDLIDAYLGELPGDSRRLAPSEWGLTVPAESAGGRPLHVGLRIADGLLTAKAPVLAAGAGVDPWMLLWWNRQTRMVRFGCTQAGDVWVHADLPVASLDERALDRLLGLVCEGALAARGYVREHDEESERRFRE